MRMKIYDLRAIYVALCVALTSGARNRRRRPSCRCRAYNCIVENPGRDTVGWCSRYLPWRIYALPSVRRYDSSFFKHGDTSCRYSYYTCTHV